MLFLLKTRRFQSMLKGDLGDGMITVDMIRTFELSGSYKLYVCTLAILPEYRRNGMAFRTLYDKFFEKLFSFAEGGIFISEMAASAWTDDGESLARTFGMQYIGDHKRHGKVFHCRLVPPSVPNPNVKLRKLLEKYREIGLG